ASDFCGDDLRRSPGECSVAKLLLRCDRCVVELKVTGHLQEAELHFGGVAGRYHVVAELRIGESWQARIVSDHRSSPAHLEAVWRSRGKVGEPIANLVARARNGGEVLCNESEIRDRTDKKSPHPAVSGTGCNAGGRHIAGPSPGGEIPGLESAVRNQIAGYVITEGRGVEAEVDFRVLVNDNSGLGL